MTKIKICGITGEDEIAALNETGVDYAGFVLYEKSKRYVTVQKARQLFEKLNKGIRKAAVTVAPERALIEDIGRAGFDLLQVHGVDAAEAERIAAQTKLRCGWQSTSVILPRFADGAEKNITGLPGL